MQYVALVLVFLVAAAILYLRYRMTRPRSTDYEAIGELLISRGLKQISVTKNANYWRYWIRGRLLLSNCARLYIVQAEEPDGTRRDIHVAFDDWPMGKGKLQVFMER